MKVLGFLDFPGAVLSGASLFGGLFENPGVNVSDNQDKDARKVVFCCFEMCFGHRTSMRSPTKSRAGRKKRRALILEWL